MCPTYGCRCSASATSNGGGAVPEPVVKIDNHTDSFATIVTIEFGDRLGELLDTVGWEWHAFILVTHNIDTQYRHHNEACMYAD